MIRCRIKILLLTFCLLRCCCAVCAESDTTKNDIIKRGLSVGPLPVLAFDQGKGLQFGALLNVYDFGDGSNYPNVRQEWYIEASAYTGGSQKYVITYDSHDMLSWTRLSVATSLYIDKKFQFFGFNGYKAYMDESLPQDFYSVERVLPYFKADFIGKTGVKTLKWEAGYHFKWFGLKSVQHESLFDLYEQWGIIAKRHASVSSLRFGFIYDSRDFEPAPTHGIWAEGHLILAPSFLGTTDPFAGYSFTFRQYFPLYADRLVFAYRLAYQGNMGDAPYYVLPTYSVVGNGVDRDGFGGFRTTRGLLSNRVQGLDVAFGNAELRWKFFRTHIFNQNVYFAINAFTDASVVTRDYDTSYRGADDELSKQSHSAYIASGKKEKPHFTVGSGFRIGINQNFIIALDYGKPFDAQDGDGAFYINTGFLF